jgi:hypothetical protein
MRCKGSQKFIAMYLLCVNSTSSTACTQISHCPHSKYQATYSFYLLFTFDNCLSIESCEGFSEHCLDVFEIILSTQQNFAY